MISRPWWLTLVGKLVLSRLPLNYNFWARVGLFRHGGMDKPEYAVSIFERHIEAAGLDGQLAGKTILELGPGDSVATAIIAASKGASAILVDSGDFACKEIDPYKKLAQYLGRPELAAGCQNVAELLLLCRHSHYHTSGIKSLRSLPNASIDFVFSNAVLEHVARSEFEATVVELKRVLKPGRLMSHEIDFRDHLGGGKNNMRFSDKTWESNCFKRAGFYTNRLTCGEVRKIFEEQGLVVLRQDLIDHEVKPSRKILNEKFSTIDAIDLNTAVGKYLLRA